MRKPIKPFKTEIKSKSRKPPKPAALFDEADFYAHDERPPRDVNEDVSQHHDGGYAQALRAADAVFGGPKEAAPAAQPSATLQEPEKRILSDLTYVDPLEARLAVAPPRRGRKPGSKNAPKPPKPEASMPDAPIVNTPEPVAPIAPKMVFLRRGLGFRQKLEMRRSMKPGERWKLRAFK